MITSRRPCSVCGVFYPSDKKSLRKEIARLLDAVPHSDETCCPMGLISPHAGYVYSGFTAMHGFSLLQGKHYHSVVIVSPSHREYFDGVSIFPGEAYETPLGTVKLDRSLCSVLLQYSDWIISSDTGHAAEHAVEVQLPFLQYVLGEFLLVPVVVGDQRRDYSVNLGEALAAAIRGKDVLLIASSDLSHYHTYERAVHLDRYVLQDVSEFDPDSLMSRLEEGSAEACGGGPMVSVMTALKHLGAQRMDVLHYCNTGDVTGDRSRVVGYLSAAAYA